jgi:8-oxo-dGTP diphosphatase
MTDGALVVGAAIVRSGRLLVAQRAHPAELVGLWELPGGKVEPGERDVAALVRECREELGIELVVGAQVGGDLPIPGGRRLRVFEATTDGEPVANEHAALAWITAGELHDLAWLPADRPLVPALAALLRAAAHNL